MEKYYGGSTNYWVGGLMKFTVQTWYDPQYLTMRLIAYIYAPTEPEFLYLIHGMGYIAHHQHTPIMYSRNNIFKNNWETTSIFLQGR